LTFLESRANGSVANLDAYGSLHPPSQLNDDLDVLRVADGSSLGQ